MSSPAVSLHSTFKTISDVTVAMTAKLKDSGLENGDAKRLCLRPFLANEALTLKMPVARAGLQIPYFDLKGKPTAFYRCRFLEYGNETGFGALTATSKEKLFRYAQPPNTLNELYLPPFMDWAEIAKTPSPLLITEGELKSACATKNGYPTVGLGGVWCFKSKKQGLALLPMFKQFIWQGRIVYIVYDSDAVKNPDVVGAENALARALVAEGADPRIIRIPAKGEKKVGLDDYIVGGGDVEILITAATRYCGAEELFRFNEEVAFVNDPGLVITLDGKHKMSHRIFIDAVYATRRIEERTLKPNGEIKLDIKSAAKEWLQWTHRNAVKRITYAPGQPRITGDTELNQWQGLGCEPAPGDVAYWHRLLEFLFAGTPNERKWFEQWLAYPIQNPGAKLATAAVLWGIRHGTGKSLIGYTMFRIYGRNASEIKDSDLHSTHNEWAENMQFIMGEEITGGDKRGIADRMKGMITQKLMRLNIKYVPSYTVPDCVNYYFTSNHPDSFYLEDDDRRFFVHEVRGEPLPPEFYAEFWNWVVNGGDKALHHYFLNLNLEGFNPQGRAPNTSSKQEMIENGRSDLGTWVAHLREDVDGILQINGVPSGCRLYSSNDLFDIFNKDGNSRVTANGLARELKRAGFQKVCEGMGVRTSKGQQRLWIVRDHSACAKLTVKQAGDLYDNERTAIDKKRKYK